MCGYNNINNSFNNISSDDTTTSSGGFSCPGCSNCSGYSSCSGCTLPSSSTCANAYVPVQTFRTIYSPATGLSNGTMFPELLSTYYPDQSLAEVNYLRNYNERRCQR